MKEWLRRKSLWGGIAALVLLGSLFFWTLSPPAAKTSERVNWYGYEEGVKKAKDANKPILLYFYTDWCTWCKRMEKETYGNPRIQEFLSLSFIPISINAESKKQIKVEGKEIGMAELARKFGIRGFPTTVFLESDGTLISPLPGYVEPDFMRKILTFVHEKAYQKMSFEEFTRQRSEFRATGH